MLTTSMMLTMMTMTIRCSHGDYVDDDDDVDYVDDDDDGDDDDDNKMVPR